MKKFLFAVPVFFAGCHSAINNKQPAAISNTASQTLSSAAQNALKKSEVCVSNAKNEITCGSQEDINRASVYKSAAVPDGSSAAAVGEPKSQPDSVRLKCNILGVVENTIFVNFLAGSAIIFFNAADELKEISTVHFVIPWAVGSVLTVGALSKTLEVARQLDCMLSGHYQRSK